VFRIKGAVSEISTLLQVSKPTIYRYLKKAPSK
jgi:predicted transcriptional regulator YheO